MVVRNTVTLFNGTILSDIAPGEVDRQRVLRPGAWIAARLLLYTYASFPRLWEPNTEDANKPVFHYDWVSWVADVQRIPLTDPCWDILTRRISEVGATHGTISDIACAIVELVLRNAEIERNALRMNPLHLPPYMPEGMSSTPRMKEDESAFMGKIRSAISYGPRLEKIESTIYRALAARSIALVEALATGAPSNGVAVNVLNELKAKQL